MNIPAPHHRLDPGQWHDDTVNPAPDGSDIADAIRKLRDVCLAVRRTASIPVCDAIDDLIGALDGAADFEGLGL